MQLLRTIGLICIFGPFAAMLVEPFYSKLFDVLEWDTENFARPVVNWVSQNTSILFAIMAFGIGVWAHYLLSTKYFGANVGSDNGLRKIRARYLGQGALGSLKIMSSSPIGADYADRVIGYLVFAEDISDLRISIHYLVGAQAQKSEAMVAVLLSLPQLKGGEALNFDILKKVEENPRANMLICARNISAVNVRMAYFGTNFEAVLQVEYKASGTREVISAPFVARPSMTQLLLNLTGKEIEAWPEVVLPTDGIDLVNKILGGDVE